TSIRQKCTIMSAKWARASTPPASSAAKSSSRPKSGRRISHRAISSGLRATHSHGCACAKSICCCCIGPIRKFRLRTRSARWARSSATGLTRHIGVSNFTVKLLEEATRLSTEPLVANQIECHPFLDQSKVIAACRKHDMAVVAYSPIARGGARNDKLLARIGAAHGKTAAQICLRFLVQQDIVVIPRTSKEQRLLENAAIFDFTLSAAEMAEIARLARRDGRLIDWSYSGNAQWD